ARPAPFARVWTYALPALFALSLLGWASVIKAAFRRQLAEPLRLGVLGVMVVAILALSFNVTLGGIRSARELRRSPFSAESAWAFIKDGLKPGDHFALDYALYDQVRFIALTQ